MDKIVSNLAEIRENFSLLAGQDKLLYIIDLSKKLEIIPENYKTMDNRVKACTSQTWIKLENPEKINMVADSESSVVKGLLRILQVAFDGASNKEIKSFINSFENPVQIFEWLNIGPTISSQRQNGFIGAINIILEKTSDGK